MDLKTAKKNKDIFVHELYHKPNSKGVRKVRKTVSAKNRITYSIIIDDLTKYIKENENVKVIFAPISDRYWSVGCKGKIDDDQIRVSGCWFPFDDRWIVDTMKNKMKNYNIT